MQSGATTMGFDVISMRDFDREDIMEVLRVTNHVQRALQDKNADDDFRIMYGHSVFDLLEGYNVFTAFLENSTRTNYSFRAAAMKSGAHLDGFSSAVYTSLKKGETFADTFDMVHGYGYDAIVIRSTQEGLQRWIKEHLNAQHADMASAHENLGMPYSSHVPMIINGGDGKNQHPTQCFLDMYTMQSISKAMDRDLDGLEVALLNDIANGRTIGSLISVAHHFDWKLHFAFPPGFGPREHQLASLDRKGVEYTLHDQDFESALHAAQIAYQSRPQKERVGIENLEEIAQLGRIDSALYGSLGEDAPFLMHPLPVDAKTFAEIADDMLHHPKNYSKFQASMGVPVRIALLAMGMGVIPSTISHHREYEDMRVEHLPFNPVSDKDGNMLFGKIEDDGMIIDHITLGMGRRLYGMLGLEGSGHTAGPFEMVPSPTYGHKDIIKLFSAPYELSPRQMEAVALLAPHATVTYIRDGLISAKLRPSLGNYAKNLVECGNDACITNVASEPVQPFHWLEKENGDDILRCGYCESPDTVQEAYAQKRFIYQLGQ